MRSPTSRSPSPSRSGRGWRPRSSAGGRRSSASAHGCPGGSSTGSRTPTRISAASPTATGASGGKQIRQKLKGGDLLVFYAGLRDVGDGRLVYALIGLLTVGTIVAARDLPSERWAENAHTRRLEIGETDVVVRGREGASGRFERALEFAGYRAGAYRVFPELLGRWGGLGVRDGYVQRSARLPEIGDPERFLDWLVAQRVGLVARDN